MSSAIDNWRTDYQRYQEQLGQQTYRCPKCQDTGIIVYQSKDLTWWGQKCDCDYFARRRRDNRY